MRWLLLCIPLLAFAEDNAVERTAKKAASATERGVTRAANATERGLKSAAKGVERGAKATDKALTNAAKKTDSWIKERRSRVPVRFIMRVPSRRAGVPRRKQ